MGNFLNSFDKENYGKKGTGKPGIVKSERTPRSEIHERSSRAHGDAGELDQGYKKRKFIKYFVLLLLILAAAAIGIVTFFYMNQVTVKNFVNAPISEAKTWGLQNNVNIETESVFSPKYDENVVMEQKPKRSSKVQKGSTVKLKVSKGADPDERIEVSDFSVMNVQQIESWIIEHKAINVKIEKKYDPAIPSGSFMSMEYKDRSLTAQTYKRKDILTVTVSKGVEVFEKNISVPDFTSKSKAEAESWAKTNEIEMTYLEAGSEKVPDDMIISQSIKPNEKVAKKDQMTVTVSIGKAAVVPSFAGATAETAPDLGSKSNLQVFVKTQYSSITGYGELISQSHPEGTYLYGQDNKKVEVVYSLGRPFLDLVGQKESGIEAYFFDLKSKGAFITYKIVYVDSDQPKGTIIHTTKESQYLDPFDDIEIQVAK